MFLDEQADRENVTYKHMEYYSPLKKKDFFAICNNMDETRGHMLSEISQTQRDKH